MGSGLTSSYGQLTTSYGDRTDYDNYDGLIPEVQEVGISGRVTSSSVGIYTVPSAKKAKVNATMVLDALGADSAYAIAIRRLGGTYHPVGNFVLLEIDVSRAINVTLEATDMLTGIGNSGSTNGTLDLDASYLELDVV